MASVMSRPEFGYEALFDKETVMDLVDEYGNEYGIKRACDTPCKTYEIRTAIEYWGTGSVTRRSNTAFAERLAHVEAGATVTEAMHL